MNDLTVRPPGGREPVPPPTFADIEEDLRQMDAAREASAVATSATPELLASLDAALALVKRLGHVLVASAAPAQSQDAGFYLLMLTRAYPNSGAKDGKHFGRLLLEDVLSLQPCAGAVDIACRHWRRNNKFMPAISELMAVIKAEDSRIKGLAAFVERLPALRDRAAAELRKA